MALLIRIFHMSEFVEFAENSELIKRNHAAAIVLGVINDVFQIEVCFVSDLTLISDFLSIDESKRLYQLALLTQRLGFKINKSDSLVQVLDQYLLNSNPQNLS